MIRTESTSRGSSLRRGLGLSGPTIILLAAIAAVRVPLHDLGIVQDGSILAGSLVFAPLAIWVAVALRRQVPNPFLTVTVVGLAYGVMLAVFHQTFWGAAFGGTPPGLGGNLEGVIAPGAEAAFFRVSALFSSLLTGTMVGVLTGALAWAIEWMRRS